MDSKIILRTTLMAFAFAFSLNSTWAQSIIHRSPENRNYILVERTDLRRYDNERYTGLTSREVRSFICPQNRPDGSAFFDGNFYVWQETRRNMHSVTSGLNDAIPSQFIIDSDGNFQMVQDNGFPSFRNFPSMPKESMSIGDSWKAKSFRSIDPDNRGIYTEIPVLAEYVYIRDDVYREQDIAVLNARWATRYGGTVQDQNGDPDLKSAMGSHNATVYVSKMTGQSLLVRDNVEEVFAYYDGSTIKYKGTILLFTEYPGTYDSTQAMENLKEFVKSNPENNVERTKEGIRLTLRDLQFLPNQDQLLPGQEGKLDLIASSLKMAPNQMYLIEGHTARIGDQSNELQLSLDRAHTIARLLIQRGISKDQIICRGSGGTKPVASNETEEGRSLNRRVEITILE